LIGYVREGLMPELIPTLRGEDIAWLLSIWPLWWHSHQQPPPLAQGGEAWTTWLILGGRGAGKTRAGAEWVRGLFFGQPPFADAPVGRIALVGESEQDVREVMIEGESGLLSLYWPEIRPRWIASRRRLEWNNGAIAQAFSAEDPESLRGPQFEAAWADELSKWRHLARLSSLQHQPLDRRLCPADLAEDLSHGHRSEAHRQTSR
jgi:phage terminase large subunit-like protein